MDFANFLESRHALPDLSYSDWKKTLPPPLISIARKDRPEITEWLFKHGAPLNILHEDITALYTAVNLNNIEVARKLLEYGANPNQSFSSRATVLIKAVQCKNLAMTQLLINSGANINQSYEGLTSLMWATYKKQPAIVAELCERGADPNFINPKGTTALITAIDVGASSEIVATLLKHGANPKIDPAKLIDAAPAIVKLIQEAAAALSATNKTEEFIISPLP